MAGLDDLRGFQKITNFNRLLTKNRSEDTKTSLPPTRVPIPVFLSQECFDQVSFQFPWLFPKQTKVAPCACGDDDKPVVKRDVAALDVNIVEEFQPFDAKGLEVTPLPVWHGADLICLGFSFSITNSDGTKTNVVYLSDISEMIDETLEFIQKLPPTDILVVDTLLRSRPHPVHFNLDQAVDLARKLQPKQTYLIGMSCDSFPSHDKMNAELSNLDVNIQLAHDGLEIKL